MCTLACHTSYEPNSFTLMQVRLSMPPPVTKALRSVVERMKTVSRFVGIDASMDGSMVLHANNDTVSIKTYMSNLTAEMGTSYYMLFPFTELMFMCMPVTDDERSNPARSIVRVDLPQLSKLLGSHKALMSSVKSRIVCCTCALAYAMRVTCPTLAAVVQASLVPPPSSSTWSLPTAWGRSPTTCPSSSRTTTKTC